MNVEAAQLFFAILALATNTATLGLLAAIVLRNRAWMSGFLGQFAPIALPLALVVVSVATGGSLWFSESVGYVPCKLCWYQRAAIFPLPLLLVGMVWRKDRRSALYLLPVLAVGSAVSVWHWLVERVPSLSGATSCSAEIPCSTPWFTEFGFVTLAWMALSTMTFTAVAVICANLPDRSTRQD